MQSAKEAVKNFLHRDHQHDTEVRETYKPAVTREIYVPVEKEEQTIALDREVHQDHHQTRVQPIIDKFREEEKHLQKVLPVEHREQKLGDGEEVRRKIESEAQKFKSTKKILPTTKTTTSAETISGEHIHHHVHEQVQPVIEREVIQPTIIHTTVPIHERIDPGPTFHPATVQPTMTMEEFRRAGGTLEGRPEVRTVYDGEPVVKQDGGSQQTRAGSFSRRYHLKKGEENNGAGAGSSIDSGTLGNIAERG